MNNWSLIYVSRNLAEASILKGMLEENEINTVLMNRQDSSYLNFGDIELYVPSHLEDVARNLISQTLMN